MKLAAVLLVAVAACGGKESKKDSAPPPSPPVADAASVAVDAVAVKPAMKPAPEAPVPDGYDFTAAARELFVVGACGAGDLPEGVSKPVVDAHCAIIDKTQDEYKKTWVDVARPFFAEKVPSEIPKKVVYPFAGGDLSTALTVYPDADEITTLSLEPAGDPRTLEALKKKGGGLEKALATVRFELDFLYRVNFSNTMNMISAMRGGQLPTQLIFGLSAMKVHGYEIVSLRYFKLDNEGVIHYLSDADLKKAPVVGPQTAAIRNALFANAEIRFRKPGGRVQIYRHMQVNLDDDHLEKDPKVLRHLEAKGQVAGMTKAASYLLSWENFKTIRDYLAGHVVWMVSDATGIAPKWGTPLGFEYETYGQYKGPHMNAGKQISKEWETLFSSQPKRELAFRFGYYDSKRANHLVIMRKKS
jgi:hypothetical protein